MTEIGTLEYCLNCDYWQFSNGYEDNDEGYCNCPVGQNCPPQDDTEEN